MKKILKQITSVACAAVLSITTQMQLLTQVCVSAAQKAAAQKKVLLIQDNLPWDSNANTKVLGDIGVDYQKVTTTEFLDVELEDYSVVIFADDQAFSTYNNYLEFKDYMELYASLGGVIVFGAADGGWADGNLTGALPGNVEKILDYTEYNYVADPKHPILTAALSDGDGAVVEGKEDQMWFSTYCSHSEFIESTLPAGANILVRSSESDNPTLVEYPLGKGRVIASGLTIEHSYSYRDNYAKKIMDDLFLYALKVSDFNGDAAQQLREYRMSINQHHILVNAADTKKPIAGAVVKIGNKTFKTDKDGMVNLGGATSQQTVIVSAEGYLTSGAVYTPKKRSVHVFYLKNDTSNGKPYPILATETNKEKDLFTNSVFFTENKSDMCRIQVTAEWNGHTPGKYELVQYGAGGKKLTSTTGIFSFAPGKMLAPGKDVYLILRSVDGTVSERRRICLKVNPHADTPDVDPDAFSDQFQITPDQKGATGSEDVASLVGDNFEVSLPMLPVQVTSEQNEDEGTCTVRFLIGVDAKTADESKGIYDYFKQSFTNYMDDVNKADRLINSLCNKINSSGKLAAHGSLGIVPDTTVEGLGYYEMVYDANHNIVSQGGGIAITVGGELSYTQQFLLAVVPLYLNVKVGAEMNTLTGMTLYANGGGASFQGEASITVSGSISGGFGVSGLVSVGAGGGVDFEVSVAPERTGTVTLKAFVEAYLLFVIDFSYDFASKTWTLWPKQNRSAAKGAAAGGTGDADTQPELMDTDYLSQTSAWNGAAGDGVNVLQSGVLPSTIPLIAEAGGSKVLVWQTTDPDAELLNSTKLMFSYYDNGVWSEPQCVNQSESADLTARLVENGDDIYLIWQKQNAVIQGGDLSQMAAQALASTDIFTAKWNGTAFADTACVLKDSTPDMLPTLAFDGDKMTAVWVKSSGNLENVFQSSGMILASDFTGGKWGKPYQLANADSYVSELAAAYHNGSLYAAYTLNGASGSALHMVCSGKDRVVASGADTLTGVSFRDGKLYCVKNGKLYICTPDSAALTAVDGQLSALSGTFVMADDGKSLIFSDGTQFFISVNENGAWSEAMELTVPEGFSVFNYSASWDQGRYSIVLNGRDADNTTSLVYLEAAHAESLDIEYATVEYDPITGEQSVLFKLTNNTSKTIHDIQAELSNADRTLFSAEKAVSIAPGESVSLVCPMDTTDIHEVGEYTLTVSNGTCTANAVVTIGMPDISLDVDTYYLEDSVILAITASNLTGTPAETTIKICEDSMDGLQIDMKNAGVITSQEDYLLLEEINLSDVEFDENGVKYLFIQADTRGSELNQANNCIPVAIYQNQELTDPDDSDLPEYDVTPSDGKDDEDPGENPDPITTTVTTTTTTITTTTTTTASTDDASADVTGTTTVTAVDAVKPPKTGEQGIRITVEILAAFAVLSAYGVRKKRRVR